MTARCGTVALIGKTNAGKSTLLNALLSRKVSIVTHKAQTTRFQVQGVLTQDDTQIVFIDTPGLFDNPRNMFEKGILSQALRAMEDVDMIVLVIDATDSDLTLYEKFKGSCTVVVNKIDKAPSPIPNPDFEISALHRTNLDALKTFLLEKMPEGHFLYGIDQISNLNEKLWASEMTREKAMLLLHAELPYELYVTTDTWEELKNGSIKIEQTIVVARENLKKIVIGHKGDKIKRISMQARQEMSAHLNQTVHLFLFVKVKENWMDVTTPLKF